MATPASVPIHVLIVDDDRPMQRLLADALTQQGFTTTVEQDGEWALRTFASRDFDAVVLDVHLPSLNGFEVARRLRASERGAHVPLIFISGAYRGAPHQREGERYGAVAYLEKPFKLAALYDALRTGLGGRYPQPPSAESASVEDVGGDVLADRQAREEQSLVESTSKRLSTAPSIRGDFRTRPFPELLAEIHRWKGTGGLLLRRDKVKKIVYFRDGEPQYVKSNLLSECLGRVMVRERMISEAACEESLRRMKASGRQQGTVLIEMGCISPHNLTYALNLQLRAKLYEIFTWPSGEYQFNQRVDLPAEPINLEMSTALLIYEGVRRAYDGRRLSEALGPVDNLYVHISPDPLYAFQDVGLGEEERWLLEAVDGRKTVAALRAMDLLPPVDTDRLLYAMRCAQVIELRTTPASSRPTAPLGFHAPAPSGPLPPPLPIAKARANASPAGADASAGGAGGAQPPSAGRRREMPALDLPESAPPPPAARPSRPSPGEPSDHDEAAVRERLAAKAAAMRRMDLFQILDVPRDADAETINQAYLAMIRENHPDRLRGTVSAELRQLAHQIFDLINHAYNTLSDDEERQLYLEDLAAGVRPELDEEVGGILSAESKFQNGEALLRQGLVGEAYAAFREAVALYDREGDFHAYLGWTRFQMEPNNTDAILEAIESLARAISLNPRSYKGYLFTGYVYKATGRPELAERQFEKAIQANPACEEALRELSLLGGGPARQGGSRR